MERASFLRLGASVFPMLWMWIKMFVFHEASFWMTLASYTEVFFDPAIKSEESEKEISEFGEADNTLPTDTDTIQDESTESEGSIMEPDSDSVALPFSSLLPEPLASEAAIAARLGIKTTVKKMKFLVPTDPRLFTDDEMPMKDGKVAQWYLQYIKEEHEKKREEKQMPFFQRKVLKITKRFKKKEKNN
ncbi:hypothetical protein AVEN_119035-1 [Araneus ventricosus]|uniref:Uncharacterized protein n=1 Tax=Araneus ventricosus TaxID=182803 RepID=A0A4Y2FDE1_ARAVE|nr:hypothetical protein AVEN_119035-1 [Araneus ventricosus]